MKLMAAALMMIAAGAMCGLSMSWAVNAKFGPMVVIPLALLLVVGAILGAALGPAR